MSNNNIKHFLIGLCTCLGLVTGFVACTDDESDQPLNFDLPQTERYHRQTDVQPSASINKHLRYIYEHDRYRAAEAKGEKLVTFTSERSRILAARAERKMQRKRIDNLFAILEASNRGYRELSYC